MDKIDTIDDQIDKIDEQIDALSNDALKEDETIKLENLHEGDIIEEKDNKEVIEDNKDNEEIVEEKTDNDEIAEENTDVEEIVEEKSDHVEIIEEKKDDELIVEENKDNSIPDKTENQKQKKKKKITDYLIWILIVLSVVVTIILLLFLFSEKKENVLTEAEKKKIIKEYGEKLEEVIESYFQRYDLLLTYEDASKMINYSHIIECSEHRVYSDRKVYIADCSIDREDVDYTYGILKQEEEEELEYEEAEKIKVYVSKETHKAILEEPSDLSRYNIYEFELKERYTNLGLLGESNNYVYYHTDDGYNHLYNYIKNEELKPSENTINILPIRFDNQYDQDYVLVINSEKQEGRNYSIESSGIYNLKENRFSIHLGFYTYGSLNRSVYTGHSSSHFTFDYLAIDNGIVYASKRDDASTYQYKSGLLNYKTGEEIIPFDYHTIVLKDGYLLADRERDESKSDYHIFDKNGNELLKGKYDKIDIMYSKDYILVEQGKDTKLINIKGEELYNYHDANKVTLNYNSFSDENGVYFQFDIDYVKSPYYCVQFSYNFHTKEGRVDYAKCNMKG